jgi:hypothetical protein
MMASTTSRSIQAVGLEVDAHPVGRRGSNRHSLFDTDADEPGMVIEAALLAAERQQVGILDKRLLQTLAEAVGIKAGPSRLDNDVKINRLRPGRSNRAFGQKINIVQDGSPCPFQKEYNLAHAAIQRLYSTSGLSGHEPSYRAEATSADAIAGRYVPFPLRFQLCLGRRTDLPVLRFEGA